MTTDQWMGMAVGLVVFAFIVFAFIKGGAGGHDFVTDYNSNDTVELFGYGGATGEATVTGNATTIALSDNTKITFEGVATPNSIKVVSI